MKKLTLGQRLKASLAIMFGSLPTWRSTPFGVNTGVTIYPQSREHIYVNKGYNRNAQVYAIVSKCAKKFGQIPWYHYKIKTSERKTWFDEYLPMTRELRDDPRMLIELRKMRKKAVDQVLVDSAISKLLAKPNRNQSRAMFHENLYGFKLLSGEGNVWLPAIDDKRPPGEMLIAPKSCLALVKGLSIWDIQQYKIVLEGNEQPVPKERLFMWKFPIYSPPDSNLSHLRGQSPLDAGLLVMQASNEANERLVFMNKNQGVAGLVYDKMERERPTPTQVSLMRQQFDSVVNSGDLAGTIAYMTGELGYIQFGLDAGQLKLLEQSDVHFKTLCNIFDVPWQLFGNADSYENRKQYKRDFIYDNIAPAAYGLRDEYNSALLPLFNLDRERDVIDCDVLSLPELAQDQKQAAEFLEKMGPRLTLNEGREYMGWERSPDPVMDKHYIPSNWAPVDQVGADVGDELNLSDLDDDV